MNPFDNYEISPCRRFDDAGLPDPNGLTFEVCEPHEADVWTLYGHLPEGGVEAIGDFATREDAEATFQRITGISFGTHDEVAARLRVMHAGPRLQVASNHVLTMLDAALVEMKSNEGLPGWWVQLKLVESLLADPAVISLRATIAEATGRAA